jgi:hypothetical protein
MKFSVPNLSELFASSSARDSQTLRKAFDRENSYFYLFIFTLRHGERRRRPNVMKENKLKRKIN